MDDISAIRHTMDLYGFAIDAQQYDLFDEVFTPDMRAEFGAKVFTSRDEIKADFDVFHAQFDVTQHSMSNMVCEVDGDRAFAVTYGTWLLVKRGAPGGDTFRATGWYEDRLVRTPDGWRINHRRPRVSYGEGNQRLTGSGDHPLAILSMGSGAGEMELLEARRRRLRA